MHWYRSLDPRERRTFWACFSGYALDAMDVHLYAFIAPMLIGLWRLSNSQAGALASVTLLASTVGGWGAGVLADNIGRVRTLQLTVVWFSVFAFLSGLTSSFESLLVTRGLQGLGFGGEWTMSAVLMAEVAAPLFRGRALGFVQSAWAVGWALAATLATALQAWLPPELAWRAIFMVGLAPALLVLAIRRVVPESPLYRQGASTLALAIFGPAYLTLTLRGTLLAFGAHGGYYALTTWLPTLLRTERKLTLLASGSYYVVLAAGSFLGYLTGAFSSDRWGRRPTFAAFAAGAMLSVLVVTLAPLSAGWMIALSFPLGFAASGIYSGFGAQFAELYPTEMRGSGQGFCYSGGRGLSAILPMLVGWASARVGLAPAIGLCSAGAFSFVILAVWMLPETRGRLLTSLAHEI